ncbi:potassium uptake protein TrkA [Desulfolithobacter dissulfuricans]|uniref:Potassium uptake protein TrkA n=2 Tax=Desulfolithobacter dissulfuricans TaxID=2795293 RepID=A0A915U125_9BACT|nr:potassium uptake protein TrkA [Desulfolithobacter dissulfuricans]
MVRGSGEGVMKKEIAVIGLGKFGFYFAQTLAELGYKVVGIDNQSAKVQKARDVLAQVYRTDATNKDALEQLGIREMTHVLVSVGDSIAASTMISMYLKELGVEEVWVKAVNPDHQRLLYKVGVDTVIIPEQLAAVHLASKVAIPGFIQYASFDTEMSFQELVVDRWAGKTLKDLDLTNRYGVQVIATRREDEPHFQFLPRADYELKKGDRLIVIRKTTDSREIRS